MVVIYRATYFIAIVKHANYLFCLLRMYMWQLVQVFVSGSFQNIFFFIGKKMKTFLIDLI